MKKQALLLAFVSLVMAMSAPPIVGVVDSFSSLALRHRWVKVDLNSFRKGQVRRALTVMSRASEVGYNGVVLSDSKTDGYFHENYLADGFDGRDAFLDAMRRVRQHAQSLDMYVAMGIVNMGYAWTLVGPHVNLVSGHPLVDVPLQVVVEEEGGERVLRPVVTAAIANGDMEDFDLELHEFANFFIDYPGAGSFVDRQVFYSGRASLRFDAAVLDNDGPAFGRIFQTIAVQPFSQYRVSVRMRADALIANAVQLVVFSIPENHAIQTTFPIFWDPDTEWYNRVVEGGTFDTAGQFVLQHFVFNSLDNREVELLLGMYGYQSGTLWWDELSIESLPTLNLLRRPDLPLRISAQKSSSESDSDGGDEDDNATVYREGVDFDRVQDPFLGKEGEYYGNYGIYHAAPSITLRGDSWTNGEIVYLSAHHAMPTAGLQMCASFTAPTLLDNVIPSIVHHVTNDLQPNGLFFYHDEIRTGGWEPLEVSLHPNSGAALAQNLETCRQVANEEAPGKETFVWNDMIDPFHNAGPFPYYSVRGTLEGSWEGVVSSSEEEEEATELPPMTVVNWNYEQAVDSLRFFHHELGLSQIVAAYYDTDSVQDDFDHWMAAIKAVEGLGDELRGVMYTTWNDNYSDLEEFAKVWWGQQKYNGPQDDDPNHGGNGNDKNDMGNSSPLDDFRDNLVLRVAFDEGYGQVAGDLTRLHTVNLVGSGVGWVEDDRGGTAVETPASDFVHVLASPALHKLGRNNRDFTVSLWVRLLEDATGKWRGLCRKGDTFDQRGFGMYLAKRDNKINYAVTTTANFNQGGLSESALVVGEWTHLAITKQGSTLSFFMNGRLDSQATIDGGTLGNRGDAYFGATPNNDARPTAVVLDDLRIYTNVALDESLIALLMQEEDTISLDAYQGSYTVIAPDSTPPAFGTLRLELSPSENSWLALASHLSLTWDDGSTTILNATVDDTTGVLQLESSLLVSGTGHFRNTGYSHWDARLELPGAEVPMTLLGSQRTTFQPLFSKFIMTGEFTSTKKKMIVFEERGKWKSNGKLQGKRIRGVVREEDGVVEGTVVVKKKKKNSKNSYGFVGVVFEAQFQIGGQLREGNGGDKVVGEFFMTRR